MTGHTLLAEADPTLTIAQAHDIAHHARLPLPVAPATGHLRIDHHRPGHSRAVTLTLGQRGGVGL